MACSGTMRFGERRSRVSLRLALRARDHHRGHVLLSGEAVDHLRVDGVRRVVLRGLGRRADDDDHAAAVESQLVEDAGVEVGVGEVVVLLQARVAEELALRGADAGEAVERDRVGDQHPAGGPEGDPPLEAGVLVVLHLHGRNAQEAADDGEVDGPVGEGEVGAVPARQPRQASRPPGQGEALPGPGCAPVGPHRLEGNLEALEDLQRLAVGPRGDPDLVATLVEPVDQRPENERVCRRGAVDPDSHAGPA